MKLESKRIGTVEVREDKIITFPDGLLGFPHLKRFFMADDPVDLEMPMKWLVSVENPEILFLVTDPGIFFKDYVFDLPADDQRALQIQSEEDASVIVILTIPADPKMITANLRGPLVINARTMTGRQVVLKDSPFEVKHYIFTEATRHTTTAVPVADLSPEATMIQANTAALSAE